MESQTSTPSQRAVETAAVAPPGFDYPPLLLTLLRGSLPAIQPWAWLVERPGQLTSVATRLAASFPDRRLVPFAKNPATDDAYGFDGFDLSGDPAVHVIRMSAPAGSEYRGQWAGFAEWLDEADDVHGEWLLRS